MVNELRPTTDPGPYTLRLYTDNPAITLSEAESVLVVRVLGNPVYGNTAEVEISGASGQAVQPNLVDMQGKPVHAQRVDQAGTAERVRLPLGDANGKLLLQVSMPTDRRVIELLKP